MLRLFVIVTAALGITLGLAGCQHSSPEKRADRAVSYVSHKLDLTDDQEVMLTGIKDRWMDARQEMNAERKTYAEKFTSMIRSEELSRDELIQMYEARKQYIEEQLPTAMDDIIAFHKQLNPEQKEKIVELLEKRMDKWNRHAANDDKDNKADIEISDMASLHGNYVSI